MKKIIISLSFLFSGIILFGINAFIINSNIDRVKEFGVLGAFKGLFWASASMLNLKFEMIFSTLLIFLGFVLLLYLFIKELKNKKD